MSSYSLRGCALGLLLAGAGCDEPRPGPDMEPDSGYQLDPVVSENIDAVKARVLADTCFLQVDTSGCDWGDFAYDPSKFAMANNTGESILIIDDLPALPPRVIRYKNRVRNYYRVGSGGTITPAPHAWRAPRTLFEGLSTFATPTFVPAEYLRPLAQPMREVYASYDMGNVGHGSFVLSLLVEANPHQPLVLMDQLSFNKFALEDLCDASGSMDSMGRMFEKTQRVASELRRVFAEHNVRFVNLSSGETLDSIRAEWREHCGGNLPDDNILRAKLSTYKPIADVLFKSPGVFTAQASINASNPQDFPFDYPSAEYPNRMLVGYFNTLDSGLDASGRGNTSALSGWPERQNVDIYLNSGVLPTRPFPYNTTPLLQVDGFGVDLFPITRTTTSWITPLALTRFIHVRYANFGNSALTDDLINIIWRRMLPNGCSGQQGNICVYQDPLRHGQQEAVRLGYRPREYVAP